MVLRASKKHTFFTASPNRREISAKNLQIPKCIKLYTKLFHWSENTSESARTSKSFEALLLRGTTFCLKEKQWNFFSYEKKKNSIALTNENAKVFIFFKIHFSKFFDLENFERSKM